jgi:hypothetical protein
MSKNPLNVATEAKGLSAVLRRIRSIFSRYGLTPQKMDRSLDLFVRTLEQFDCGASVALTAVVLARNPHLIFKYLNGDIEFVVHGYTHVDYSQVPPENRLLHLRRAYEIFKVAGVPFSGFRSPYLRDAPGLNAAIEKVGYAYVCNQPIMWDVPDLVTDAPHAYPSYQCALDFYRPWPASKRMSLPRLSGKLVQMPVSLPDDEMLIERFYDKPDRWVESVWRNILHETHRRQEMFVVQLHPERIALCQADLSALLEEARALSPPVWIARLDEVDRWWRARTDATMDVSEQDDATYHLAVSGPPGTMILARGVEMIEPTSATAIGDDGYRRVRGMSCTVRASTRPFIGVSRACSGELISFLRQQGYIVQASEQADLYSIYLDRSQFAPEQARSLLEEIEQQAGSLVRLARWPDGYHSVLCITGDIDALTLWDYGLRLLGK